MFSKLVSLPLSQTRRFSAPLCSCVVDVCAFCVRVCLTMCLCMRVCLCVCACSCSRRWAADLGLTLDQWETSCHFPTTEAPVIVPSPKRRHARHRQAASEPCLGQKVGLWCSYCPFLLLVWTFDGLLPYCGSYWSKVSTLTGKRCTCTTRPLSFVPFPEFPSCSPWARGREGLWRRFAFLLVMV